VAPVSREERKERAADLGESEEEGLRPMRAWSAGVGRGAEFWPSLALSTCKARIELLSRVGPRGIIRSKWALPARSA
jgi:hypothetical protein